MQDELILYANRMKYSGWESMRVSRAMDKVCGSFAIQVSKKFMAGWKQWKSLAQAAVEIRLGDDPVLTGIIDSVEPSLGDQTNLLIEGRDKTCDLVDCTNIMSSYHHKQVTVLYMIESICRPFGVKVINRVEDIRGFVLSDFHLNPGETAFEALDRFGAEYGFIYITDENGNLIMTNSGSERAKISLKYGGPDGNIENFSGKIDHTNNFSRYVVKMQAASSVAPQAEDEDGDVIDAGSAGWDNAAAALIVSEKDGLGIKRYRPLLIQAHTDPNSKNKQKLCDSIADWNSRIHGSRAHKYTAVVPGWRQGINGDLWRINQIVSVTVPDLSIYNEEWLIGETTYTRDNTGTRTTLGLALPGSYEIDPKQKRIRNSMKKTGWLS